MRRIWLLLTALSLTLTSCSSDDKPSKRDKRTPGVLAIVKHYRGRILQRPVEPGMKLFKPSPIKHVYNGPYYINHYFYCDGFDPAFHSTRPPQLNKFEQDLYNLQPPKNNFEVQFAKPYQLPSSGYNVDSVESGFVTTFGDHREPGVHEGTFDSSGQVVGEEENFGISTQSGEEGAHGHGIESEEHTVSVVPAFGYALQNGGGLKPLGQGSLVGTTSGRGVGLSGGKVISIPDHPLENDPTKASYDTPGAVDSYGDPVHHKTNIAPPQIFLQKYPSSEEGKKIEDYFSAELDEPSQENEVVVNVRFGRELKKEDEQLTEEENKENLMGISKNITELVKAMRMRSSKAELEENENKNETSKHPNHKYET